MMVENKIIDHSMSVNNRERALPLIEDQLDDTILRNINEGETAAAHSRSKLRGIHLKMNQCKSS